MWLLIMKGTSEAGTYHMLFLPQGSYHCRSTRSSKDNLVPRVEIGESNKVDRHD